MAIPVKSEQDIFDGNLGYYRGQFPTRDLSDKGFLGLLARAQAQGAVEAQDSIRQADNDACPAYQQDIDGNLRSRTSTQGLDDWAQVFGVAGDSPGRYGRRGATVSTGGAGVPTASASGILIPAGSQLSDTTGQVLVQTTADITTNGPPNTVAVSLVSVTKGTQANLSIGSVLTWVSPPVGVGATVTLTSPLADAKDREENDELLARILDHIQNPPRGGTAADYRFWTLEAVDSNGQPLGIDTADVHPLRGGSGTVDVYPLFAGEGAGRIPSAAIRASLQTSLDGKRPVTASVSVGAAQMPAAKALRIRVRVEPIAKYPWDWNDGRLATVITAYNASTPSISCTAPAALLAELDAGRTPRIQVILSTSGAPVRPVVVRAMSYSGAGPHVIVIESALPVAPTIGTDYFWAAGPFVETIADDIANYVSTLRTSRQAGYADPFDPWDYIVSLSKLCSLVMNAHDTDGTKFIAREPDLATDGVQIAVGTGAFAVADYEPRDVSADPEVAYLRQGGVEVVR